MRALAFAQRGNAGDVAEFDGAVLSGGREGGEAATGYALRVIPPALNTAPRRPKKQAKNQTCPPGDYFTDVTATMRSLPNWLSKSSWAVFIASTKAALST